MKILGNSRQFSVLFPGLVLLQSVGGARWNSNGEQTPSLGARVQKVREILDAQARQDGQASDRMACWCQTHIAVKRQYVEDLTQQAELLSHEIQAQTAANARVSVELEQHKGELADGEDSLGKATAIRRKAAAKYEEEHQRTSQSIDQIDDALQALRRTHGHELSAVQQMRQLLDRSDLGNRESMLQFSPSKRRRLDTASSPQVVYGVLKQMRQTFEANLKDMQEDESTWKSRHEDLSNAKAQELESIKRQVSVKEQRVAEGKVQVSRKRELMDRIGKLLDTTQMLVSSMDKVCDSSSQASQGRQQERQRSLVALAAAQAELAGAQLLATSAMRGAGAVATSPEDLCLLAAGLQERNWREKAQAACEAAKSGRSQEAAEQTDALQEEVRKAAGEAEDEVERCHRNHEDAALSHDRAMKDASVRASVLGNTKEGADSQIDDIKNQAATCQKAKTEFLEIENTTSALVQLIRTDASRIAILLQPKTSGPASEKLQEAAGSINTLTEDIARFRRSSRESIQAVLGALDKATLAASKVLIPLQMIRADAEESALAVHEEQARAARRASAGPNCNLEALTAKAQQLQSHAKQLSDASVSLAWSSLR